jgi:hypothetical protein
MTLWSTNDESPRFHEPADVSHFLSIRILRNISQRIWDASGANPKGSFGRQRLIKCLAFQAPFRYAGVVVESDRPHGFNPSSTLDLNVAFAAPT